MIFDRKVIKGESIEVEQLNVTANGTYTASEGHAYSPVTVNVPTVNLSTFEYALQYEDNGLTAHFYGKSASNFSYNNIVTKTIIEDSITTLNQFPYYCTAIATVEGGASVEIITANSFRGCSSLSTLNFPKLRQLTGTAGFQFGQMTALTSATLGSVGYGLETIQSSACFDQDTRADLVITIYCTGANADTLLSKIRAGATNATIYVKASENTVYGGVDYNAGDTMITSEVL